MIIIDPVGWGIYAYECFLVLLHSYLLLLITTFYSLYILQMLDITRPLQKQKIISYKWYKLKCNVCWIFIYKGSEFLYKQDTTDCDDVPQSIDRYTPYIKKQIDQKII